MIRSFQHRSLERYFLTGSTKGIQAAHAAKLRLQLTALEAASRPEDLRTPESWRLHALRGDLKGFWSITVNGNWRLIFRFVEEDVELLDYVDYH
jgi:toxin HigB-1